MVVIDRASRSVWLRLHAAAAATSLKRICITSGQVLVDGYEDKIPNTPNHELLKQQHMPTYMKVGGSYGICVDLKWEFVHV